MLFFLSMKVTGWKNNTKYIRLPRLLHHSLFDSHPRCHCPTAESVHLVSESVNDQYMCQVTST